MAEKAVQASSLSEQELCQLLQADARRCERYLVCLREFVAVYTNRKARFERIKSKRPHDEDNLESAIQQQHRIFTISANDDPWNVFTSHHASTNSRLAIKRLVFEWSDLHVTSVHAACANGDLELVRRLLHFPGHELQWRPCALARDSSGRIPLHHAVIHERYSVIEWLLARKDASLQVHGCDNAAYTAVHYVLFKLYALARRARHRRSQLMQSRNMTIASAAMELRGRSRRFRKLWFLADTLIRRHAPRSIQEADLRCRGDLWDACRAGDLDRVRFVVAQYCNKIERRQRNEPKPPPWYTLRHLHRYSLLHEACDQQHLDIVCYLVAELRVPRHLQDASGCTALHVAAMRGFVAGCAVLLETECDSNEDVETLCLSVDARGRTPLHWSLLSGSPSCGKAAVAKYLVRKCMAALHVSDFDGITPFHLAIWRGDIALVHELIACGANVNATTVREVWRPAIQNGEKDGEREQNECGELCSSKALWAPYGLRFQQRLCRRRDVLDQQTKTDTSLEEDVEIHGREINENEVQTEAQPALLRGSTSLAACKYTTASSEKNEVLTLIRASRGVVVLPDSSNDCANVEREFTDAVVMDTFRYWIHTRQQQKAQERGKITPEDLQACTEAPLQAETNDDDAPLRYCKYSATACLKCKSLDERPPANGKADEVTAKLSPLVLAIRMCAHASAHTKMETRVPIVELLLVSGAAPDGDEQAAAGHTPLSEALAVATQCPQVLLLLHRHGATGMSLPRLTQIVVSMANTTTTTTMTKSPGRIRNAGVEAVVLDVVAMHLETTDMDKEGSKSTFSALYATLFASRWFHLILRLRRRRLSLCIWDVIRSGLAVHPSKGFPAIRHLIDREHLRFLCKCTFRQQQQQVATDNQADELDNVTADATELWMLLRDCIDMCLQKWTTRATRLVPRHEQDACHEMLLASLHLLFCPRDPTKVVPVAADLSDRLPMWLDACITLAFHEAALVMCDAYVTTRGTISIDRALVQYGTMLTSRHHGLHHLLNAGQAPQQFLVTLLERWLKMVEEQQQADAPVMVSVDAVLRCCAYNAPFESITQIVNLVGRKVHDVLAALLADTGARVHGKSLAEWLVHHARKDVIALLLTKEKTSNHHWTALWQRCVGAVAAAERSLPVETESKRAFLTWLLELLHSSSLGSSVDVGPYVLKEEDELLQWLVLKRAIWCDSPLVFSCIIVPLYEKQLQCSAVTVEDRNEHPQPDTNESSNALALPLFKWLESIHFFHEVARANALRLATYLVQVQFHATACGNNLIDTWRVALQQKRQQYSEKSDQENEQDASGVTPLELCHLLGHIHLARVLRSTLITNDQDDVGNKENDLQALSDVRSPVVWYGGLHTILSMHANVVDPFNTYSAKFHHTLYGKHRKALDHLQCLAGDWRAACTWNLVSHLDALALHRVPMTPDAASLWLISVENGSLAALEWLLDHTDFVQRCAAREETKDNPVNMLLLAASKHASDLHAHMTVLLLSKLAPYYSGRLAGDGTDTTLLHRCVGFANANLVQRAVETLLASVPGSSIEVRDAFGDTPIVHACVAGNLATLCFLVKTMRARLENEYEGQSSFYYTLQLLPSFAWRWIVGILLATHCNRGFLHCDAEDRLCGCKGWEDPPGGAAMEAEVAQKCGFCGHDAESHRVVPHPPWFMDQYETYVGIESTSSSSCESISDPSELEDHRGRLDASTLVKIAHLRYLHVLEDHALLAVDCDENALSSSALGIEETTKDASGVGWAMLPLHGLEGEEGSIDTDVQEREHDEEAELDRDASTSRENVNADDGGIFSIETPRSTPWYLEQDLSALHPESCCCHHRDFLTTAAMWKQLVVSHWLRHSATQCVASAAAQAQARNSPLTLHTAFNRWRRAPISKTDGSVQTAGVALPTIQQRKRLCTALRHWRFANAFVALQRWKHATDTSMQLRHHRVESVLDDVVAHMRQNRFTSLRARQMQLQKSIAGMQWKETALELQ